MKKFAVVFLLFGIVSFGNAQKSIDKVLKKLNVKSVPYITVEDLAAIENVSLLDAREKGEYEVSHLKSATYTGYNHFVLDSVTSNLKDKEKVVVVYCSIGVRSEDIAEKLKAAGYENVFNLYGGIFEWKNKKYPIYNSQQQETDSVHVFSKEWGKYLKNGKKIY